MADHSAHHEHDADAEYLATPGSSYEHTDADVRSIVSFGLWLAALAVGAHLLLAGGFVGMKAFFSESGEQRFPLAVGQQPPRPPAPVLQQYPDREMTTFRASDRGDLESYGWIDKDKGTVHIPIEDAMRQTLEKGLPSRSADQGASVTPGMMATDSSAGRLLERRRQ